MVVFLSGARYFGKLEVRRAESIKKASESLEECCKISCCEIKTRKDRLKEFEVMMSGKLKYDADDTCKRVLSEN